MITAAYRSREVWAMPLALMAVVLALGIGGDPVRDALRFDRVAIGAGEWWRLFGGNLVHLGWWHLFLNEIGVLVLVLLCPERLSPWVWLRRLLLVGLGMSLGLYALVPEVRWYVGLSRVLHGLFLLALGRQVMQKDLIAAGCLAYLVGKIGWELFAGVPISDEEAIGGTVLVESHLYGSLAALFYGLVFRSFTRVEILRLRGEAA